MLGKVPKVLGMVTNPKGRVPRVLKRVINVLGRVPRGCEGSYVLSKDPKVLGRAPRMLGMVTRVLGSVQSPKVSKLKIKLICLKHH